MDSHFGQVRPEIGVGQMEEEWSEVLLELASIDNLCLPYAAGEGLWDIDRLFFGRMVGLCANRLVAVKK